MILSTRSNDIATKDGILYLCLGKKTASKEANTSDTSATPSVKSNSLTYKLLSQCNDLLDNMDLKICEKNFEEENEEEIALKDKHR